MKFIKDMGWSDVEMSSDFEDIQYTHWNHKHSKGSRIDDHVLGLYSLIKDKAKQAGLAAKAKLRNSKLAWRRKVSKKLEVFDRFAKEGRLNRYRLAHLQVAQRDILELEADDLAAEAYKGKMLSIQFDGKSTRHFFKPPKKVKKCIKSMGNSVDSLLMILEMKLLLSSTDFGKTAKG